MLHINSPLVSGRELVLRNFVAEKSVGNMVLSKLGRRGDPGSLCKHGSSIVYQIL